MYCASACLTSRRLIQGFSLLLIVQWQVLILPTVLPLLPTDVLTILCV